MVDSKEPRAAFGDVDGLWHLLGESIVSSEAEQRWLDAAHRGFALARLRQECARYGYVAFPVWEYLASLARASHVTLDAVLAAFDLRSRPVVGRETAERIARVLRRIGCGREQALHMMRLSFAEVHGFSPLPELTTLSRGGAAIQDVDRCEQLLSGTEARYPDVLRSEIEAVGRAVVQAYESA
jgi:hypothetical protein